MDIHPGILIVDRDTVVAEALREQLAAQGYDVHSVSTSQAVLDALHRERANSGTSVGVVLADQDTAGQADDLDLIRRLHEDWPSVVPIMTSAFRKVESAVHAMRLGAADYLLKPIVEQELIEAVRRAVQRHLLLVEHATAQQEIVSQPAKEPDDRAAAHDLSETQKSWQPIPLSEALKAPEQRILLAALEANDWNRGETAKQLDINRTTLYKKIRQYRLDEPA